MDEDEARWRFDDDDGALVVRRARRPRGIGPWSATIAFFGVPGAGAALIAWLFDRDMLAIAIFAGAIAIGVLAVLAMFYRGWPLRPVWDRIGHEVRADDHGIESDCRMDPVRWGGRAKRKAIEAIEAEMLSEDSRRSSAVRYYRIRMKLVSGRRVTILDGLHGDDAREIARRLSERLGLGTTGRT